MRPVSRLSIGAVATRLLNRFGRQNNVLGQQSNVVGQHGNLVLHGAGHASPVGRFRRSLCRHRTLRAAALCWLTALGPVTLALPSPRANATPATPAQAESLYVPPVEALVVDLFRPGEFRWTPANRGIDYDTYPGQPVRSAGDGTVVFAGQVGGTLHVVVLHADGLRSTYAFLQSIEVTRGDSVVQGQTLGTANERLHFGVRAGTAYLNPVDLFSTPYRVHLIPLDAQILSAAEERKGLLDHLAGLARPASWFVASVDDLALFATPIGMLQFNLAEIGFAIDAGLVITAPAFDALGMEVEALDLALIAAGLTHSTWGPPGMEALATVGELAWRWGREMEGCTPESEAPTQVAPHDRILVLVSGLGSSSPATPDGEEANLMGGGAFSVDWPSLGFRPENVYRFSYTGGSTRDGGFTADATLDGLEDPAGRLRKLLNELGDTHAGQAIDVVAHSQGGLVSRAAVSNMELFGHPPLTSPVASLVTLSSPHQGAELADLLNGLKPSLSGQAVLALAGQLRPLNIDPTRQTIVDLDPDSAFIAKLHDADIPEDTALTSVGGDGDPTVTSPSTRTGVEGAHHTLLHVPGIGKDHDALPALATTTTEIALAQARMGPVCQTIPALVTRELEGRALRGIEDRAGLTTRIGLANPLPSLP